MYYCIIQSSKQQQQNAITTISLITPSKSQATHTHQTQTDIKIMTEQSVTTKVKRDPRLGAWFALMTFSIISLCATTSGAGRTKSGAEKWVSRRN
jgi:hypothetical protein